MPGVRVAGRPGQGDVRRQAGQRSGRGQIRAEYNLDKPFIVQYLLFLKNALTLDFGKTFSGQLVIDVIGRAFPVTIKLA